MNSFSVVGEKWTRAQRRIDGGSKWDQTNQNKHQEIRLDASYDVQFAKKKSTTQTPEISYTHLTSCTSTVAFTALLKKISLFIAATMKTDQTINFLS